MPTPNTPDMIHQMLQALESPSKDLTEWEEDFIDSITIQFQKKKTLSDKQFEILERIYAHKTD